MAALHAPVDCIKLLQRDHEDKLTVLEEIKEIKIEFGEEAHKHGGWNVAGKSLEVAGAQERCVRRGFATCRPRRHTTALRFGEAQP